MKNQITFTFKWVSKILAVLLMTLISLPSIAQNPGGGRHHGGHGGPGNGGGPHPGLTCNAHFNHHRDSLVNGVVFNNFDGSGAATYAWDFGDGSTSTSSDPSHVYADSGFYYVCLTVTDTIGGGCTDTYCDSIHVFTPAPHCNAHFGARPDSIANGVRFNSGRGTHGPANSTATYAWDFGDGSTSVDQNPSHTYAAAGTYYVCLTVSNTNAGGTCTDTQCDSVNTDFPHHGGPHHGTHRLANQATTGLEEDVLVTVYPNPMVERTTFHIENTSGNVTLRVFGMTGQIAFTKTLSNGDNEISKENLSEGLYFYSIEDGNSTISKGKLRVY